MRRRWSCWPTWALASTASYRDQLVESFELDVDRRCGTYSTGNRQKVALVAAFATQARLLVLDEPTSGLDPLMEQLVRECITTAAARGQTVFLSPSHDLAEVEAVYQRVGILREGRLVEVAGLDELRRFRYAQVNIEFAGPGPDLGRLLALSGVRDVHRLSDSQISLTMTGPPAAALRILAAAEVTALEIREASLEEIFLEYYGRTTR